MLLVTAEQQEKYIQTYGKIIKAMYFQLTAHLDQKVPQSN